ncbi:MAG TPA: hypothetical protein VFI38_00425 [Candidatus Acidoferrum sp.]|nr:hypothetical protein [Candidatus Acidoferrum sp.]
MSRHFGRGAFAFCLVALSILALVHLAQSCADIDPPFNDFSRHPDVPIDKFAQGNLGILQPTFARSYLVVAYRYLSGVPLSNDEQQAAVAVWQSRGIEPTDIYPDYYSGGVEKDRQNSYLQAARDYADGPADWVAARAQIVSSPAPRINQLQGLDTYNNYLNCSNDAFATAAATLKLRAAKFGKNHPGVIDWVASQDTVFANCGGDPKQPLLPQAPDSSLPEILRYDREYQISAAYMYSVHSAEAIKSFQHIAEEPNSPWHDLAPYLIARTMARHATLDDPPAGDTQSGKAQHNAFLPEEMQAAADYAAKLLADNPTRPFAEPLRELIHRIEFRLHPTEQSARLSHDLSNQSPAGRFYNYLWDYTWLLDQRQDVSGEYSEPASPEAFASSLPDRQKDPLTDWIVTFQLRDPRATQHALEAWRDHRESVPWLLATLSKTEANSPHLSEILSVAERVPVSSPAYVSVFYHRMRLANANHNYPEVRRSIDAFLATSADLPSVARDFLLDLRLDAAADLNDAVRFLPRASCTVDRRLPPPNCWLTMPEHSALYLNALPLELQVETLRSNGLADEEKAKFVRNVWLRAALLGRHDVAQPLAAQAFRPGANQFPVKPEDVARLVKDYESTAAPEDKEFAAVFLMQHQYAFGYDMGSMEPWCASPNAFKDENSYSRYSRPFSSPLNPPAYLSEPQRKQAESEQATLDHLDSQANYYVRIVLDFAKKHPEDPRVPEALSRAVKNTRMNCGNPRTGPLSKSAYDLLHQRFPNSTWAKNTKYWFD